MGGFDERYLLGIVLEIAGATDLVAPGGLEGFRALHGFDDGFDDGFDNGFDELDRRSKCLE